MKPQNKPVIVNVYYYLFTGISVIVFSIGLFLLSQHLVKRFLLPKYYMSWNETRCDYPQTGITSKQCHDRLEEDRTIQKTIDLFNSLTLVAIGLLIFGMTKWVTSKE